MIKTNQNTHQKPIKIQSKIDQKSIEHRLRIEVKSIENRSQIYQQSNKITAGAKNVVHFVLEAVLEASWARLRGQHSSKLASQIEGKSIKNQCKNRSKNRCLLSSSFDAILMDFWREMEACWHKNRIKNRCQLRKADFPKLLKNK